MENNYCPYNLGLKFKKAGYNEGCETCSRILYTEAEEWLDEKHGFIVSVEPYVTVEGFFYLYKIFWKVKGRDMMVKKIKERVGFDSIPMARNEGMSAALDYIMENDGGFNL